MNPRRAVLLAALMVSVSLAGCFGEAEVEEDAVVSLASGRLSVLNSPGTISPTPLMCGATTPLT